MNIAEILKFCPRGTELYSLIHGEVFLAKVEKTGEYPIKVITRENKYDFFSKDGFLYPYNFDGECVLFPSKEQRNWSKFRIPINRGDIMMQKDGTCPFIASGEMYTELSPKYICGINTIDEFQLSLSAKGWSSAFYIPASEEAKKELFDKMKEAGYKWNTYTLELEKIEPKFKEGDVLVNKNSNTLFLLTKILNNDIIQGYCLVANDSFELYGLPISSFKLASKEDRDKLFSAILKGNYKYDKEQHKLIKQKFKPFDKVLVRNATNDKWSINLFSYYDEKNKYFPYVCLDGCYVYCVPYETNEYFVGKTVNIRY